MFGSWKKAIESSGLNYDLICMNKRWTKGVILSAIKERIYNNIDIQGGVVQKEESALYGAAFRFFGSWENALKSIGIDYTNVRLVQLWDKNLVVRKIKERSSIELSLSARDVSLQDSKLFNAAIRYFHSWEDAIIKSGLDYNLINKRSNETKWTEDLIIESILNRYKLGLNLSMTIVRKEDNSLFKAACNHLGSWEKAIELSGIDYNLVRQDKELVSYYGIEFEKLLKKILEEIYMKPIKKGFSKNIKPDFIVENGHWVDAKLSEETIYFCDTIQKYEPFCDYLTIVYLRGEKEKEAKITNKTKLTSAYKLINGLSIDRQEYYSNLLDNLWAKAEEQIAKQFVIEGNPDNPKGYIGVKWSKANKRWTSKIAIDNNEIWIGSFTSEYLAALAYDESVIDYKLSRLTNFKFNPYIQNKNKSKFNGVSWHSAANRWRTRITVNNHSRQIGSFENEIDAAICYNNFIIKNNLNRKLNEINKATLVRDVDYE